MTQDITERWIPVTTQLPCSDDYVLIYSDAVGVTMAFFNNQIVLSPDDTDLHHATFEDADGYTYHDVTHWMHPPEPPTKSIVQAWPSIQFRAQQLREHYDSQKPVTEPPK